MLAGVPVATILATLPTVRKPARARKRTHQTNMGELIRLMKPYGLSLGRRQRTPPPQAGMVLLRIQADRGRNWHWAVLSNGTVYDPADLTARTIAAYPAAQLSWYEVERVATP